MTFVRVDIITVVCFLYRVWLSGDRANQQSMIDYAEEYMNYGIKVIISVYSCYMYTYVCEHIMP